VLERIGLKDAVLADAHVPGSLQMRDALTGKLIADVALGERIVASFGYPYAVTHRADIHRVLLDACRNHDLVTLETGRHVEGYE
jgi:salicylate hydroxylase